MGAGELAREVVGAQRLERHRIERVRRAALPEREQSARVPDDVRVGGVRRRAGDAQVAGCQVGDAAEERLARRALVREARRAHPAIAVGGPAVAQAEGVDHAVAVEPVVAAARRELRIRAVAVERSVQLARQLALDRQIEGLALDQQRRRSCPSETDRRERLGS